jgi:ribosome-associated protein
MSSKDQPSFLPDGASQSDSDSTGQLLSITPSLKIPLREISFEFSRASGPGGQHVNCTDSSVQLRLNIESCSALSQKMRGRLRIIARRKINGKGELLISVSESRSQLQNKRKALQQLEDILREAARKIKRRKKTVVPKASKARRLQGKKKTAEKKLQRQSPSIDE